jgi:hypothetical protein
MIHHVEGLSRGIDLSESSLHGFGTASILDGFAERDGGLCGAGWSIRDQPGLQDVQNK